MIFSEKLYLLRKNKGYTQEELAEKLCVSRQAIAKWESGQSYPDIVNLIQISDLMNVTVDYLVRDQECSRKPIETAVGDIDKIIQFRLKANVNTYAAFMNETDSTRYDSHDYKYEEEHFRPLQYIFSWFRPFSPHLLPLRAYKLLRHAYRMQKH